MEAMVRGGSEVWEAVTSFCELVMLAKEQLAADLRLHRRPKKRPVRRTCTSIFGHRRGRVCGRRAAGSSPSDQD